LNFELITFMFIFAKYPTRLEFVVLAIFAEFHFCFL
jgi:hypothetical protein